MPTDTPDDGSTRSERSEQKFALLGYLLSRVLFLMPSLRTLSNLLREENSLWIILIFTPIAHPILYILGSIFNGRFLYILNQPYEFIYEYLYNFITSLVTVSLLILFNTIFGQSPIAILRAGVERRRLDDMLKQRPSNPDKSNPSYDQYFIQPTAVVIDKRAVENAIDSVDTKISRDRVSSYDSNQLLSLYALESRKIATRTQARAGVFLFVGTIVAGLGLGFFFYFNVYIVRLPDTSMKHIALENDNSRTIEDSQSKFDITDKILLRLPGIAILFFIEFVALFFLRLFKSTMDEYRLYEEIARIRETTLIALKLSFERGDESNVKSIIENSRLFSTIGRLAKDETTEFIENRKLQKDEIILLESIIDVFKRRSEIGDNKTEKNKGKE